MVPGGAQFEKEVGLPSWFSMGVWLSHQIFKKIFKTKLVSSTLQTVVVKFLYSPTHFIQLL